MTANPTRQRPVQTLVLLAAVLAGAVLLASAIVGTATAQELPGQNETNTPQATQAVEQLGDLVIHAYDYDDGEMTIDATWGGASPTSLTATEMVEMDSGGATEISFKQIRLMPDSRTEITMAVDERSSGVAAVLLSTPNSIENSDALLLQAGDAVERGPVPFGTASILVGLAALGGAGGAFAFTAREHEDDAEGERRERIA